MYLPSHALSQFSASVTIRRGLGVGAPAKEQPTLPKTHHLAFDQTRGRDLDC